MNYYKDYFSFTDQEKRGIYVFFVLTLLIIGIMKFWPSKVRTPLDVSEYYFPADSTHNETSALEDEVNTKNKKIKIFQKFSFDPNQISYDSLLFLGFSKFGAKSLTNYISKGGKIKTIEKLKTIYGLDTTRIEELREFISFSPSQDVPKKYENVPNEPTEFVKKSFDNDTPREININSADSIEWVAIKGIGPYTASKIIKYRNRLGGFIKKEQILEAGLIKDSLYQILQTGFKVENPTIAKININQADYKTLTTHPYITQDVANAILKYRKQHGNFSDPNHIRRIVSIKEAVGMKILPYLKVE